MSLNLAPPDLSADSGTSSPVSPTWSPASRQQSKLPFWNRRRLIWRFPKPDWVPPINLTLVKKPGEKRRGSAQKGLETGFGGTTNSPRSTRGSARTQTSFPASSYRSGRVRKRLADLTDADKRKLAKNPLLVKVDTRLQTVDIAAETTNVVSKGLADLIGMKKSRADEDRLLESREHGGIGEDDGSHTPLEGTTTMKPMEAENLDFTKEDIQLMKKGTLDLRPPWEELEDPFGSDSRSLGGSSSSRSRSGGSTPGDVFGKKRNQLNNTEVDRFPGREAGFLQQGRKVAVHPETQHILGDGLRKKISLINGRVLLPENAKKHLWSSESESDELSVVLSSSGSSQSGSSRSGSYSDRSSSYSSSDSDILTPRVHLTPGTPPPNDDSPNEVDMLPSPVQMRGAALDLRPAVVAAAAMDRFDEDVDVDDDIPFRRKRNILSKKSSKSKSSEHHGDVDTSSPTGGERGRRSNKRLRNKRREKREKKQRHKDRAQKRQTIEQFLGAAAGSDRVFGPKKAVKPLSVPPIPLTLPHRLWLESLTQKVDGKNLLSALLDKSAHIFIVELLLKCLALSDRILHIVLTDRDEETEETVLMKASRLKRHDVRDLLLRHFEIR